MQVDALAIRLRPRTPYEAADLGTRLCQSAWRDVYRCYAVVALPVFGLCVATSEFSWWLPAVAIWWLKPWLDRTILFVLSRAAFGQRTSLNNLWRAAAASVVVAALPDAHLATIVAVALIYSARVSARRAVVLADSSPHRADSSESGRPGALCHERVCLGGNRAVPCCILASVLVYATRAKPRPAAAIFLGDESALRTALYAVGYAAVVLFIEPFYVASGFTMYLSRRAELEAWDIEQEFRRAFGN